MNIEEKNITLRKLTPKDGYTLTNGETYSKEVYLGIEDDPTRWWEIKDEDVPHEDEEEDK